MKIQRGYKFKLEPKHRHLAHLNNALGANRFVWNKLLKLNLDRLNNKQNILWFHEMCWFITLWKKSEEYAFLNLAPAQSLQQTAKALERAFKDAFDKTQPHKRIPVFKKLGKNEAGVKYPQGFSLDVGNEVIKLPKLGWVKYRNCRNITGELRNVTVTRKSGNYTVSIQTEYEVNLPLHPATSMIGLDLGVEQYATLSDESVLLAPVEKLDHLAVKLKQAQRKLSRKVKFSSNWTKQTKVASAISRKIANVRNDFQHKASTYLSKNHAMIVIEDLKVKNMTKSSKGTIDKPGSKVKQKSGLNRSILNQGWGAFSTMLEYKQSWAGGWVLKVNPKFTSQQCPCCKFTSKENRKTQSAFKCISCGYENNADYVAALNILSRGKLQLESEKVSQPQDIAGMACQVNDAVMSSAAGTNQSSLMAA